MDPLRLDRDLVRQHTTEKVYPRAQAIVEDGQIVEVVRRGNRLDAVVWGSDVEPYRVRIVIEAGPLGTDRLEAVTCTCPYSFAGWCKHAAAVVLMAIDVPGEIPERAALASRLDDLGADELRTVLLELDEAHLHLTDEIEARAEGRDPEPPSWADEIW
ncbi:MAG: SWIM zinc finger family protein [Bacteroidota bacterium]